MVSPFEVIKEIIPKNIVSDAWNYYLPKAKTATITPANATPTTLDRQKRVSDAHLAIAALKTDTQKSLEEKRAVIASNRQILQSALDEIVTEQKKEKAEEKLQALKVELDTTLGAKNALLEEETKLLTETEKIMRDGREVFHEVKNGSTEMRIWYGALAIGGAAAAKWMWDHSFGWLWEKVMGKDGVKGTIGNFLSSLAAIGGGLGLAFGYNRSRNKDEGYNRPLPPTVQGTIDPLVKLGIEAADYSAYNAKLGTGFIQALREKRGTEFIINNAGGFAEVNGKFFIINRWKENIEINGKLFHELMNNGPTTEAYYLWGGSGVTYVIAKEMMSMVCKGTMQLPSSPRKASWMIARSIAGPLEMIRDNVALVKALGLAAIGNKEAAIALKVHFYDSTWLGKLNYFEPNLRTAEGMQKILSLNEAIAFAGKNKYWKENKHIASLFNINSDADFTILKERFDVLLKKIRESLNDMPLAPNDPFNKFIKLGKRYKSDAEDINNFKQKLIEEIENTISSTPSNPNSPNTPHTTTNSPTTKTSVPPDTPNSSPVKNAGKAADQVSDTLKAAKISNLTKALTAAGMAGDAFSLATAYYEYAETEELMKKTDNPEMKKMYEQRKKYIYADVVIGTTGLVTGGMALAGVGAAVAAPISLATFPASIALGGMYKMHQWNEALLLTPADIAKQDTHDVLSTLRFKPDGEALGQILSAVWENKSVNLTQLRKEQLEDQKRLNSNRFKALAIQTTTLTINEENNDPKVIERNKREIDTYLFHKAQYIEEHAKGTPMNPLQNTNVGQLLSEADAYAKLQLAKHQHEIAEKNQPQGNGIYESTKEKSLFPDANLPKAEQAKKYAKQLRLLKLGKFIALNHSENQNPESTESLRTILREEVKPQIVSFIAETKREDLNFKTLWPDSDAGDIIFAHVQKIVDTKINQASLSLLAALSQKDEQSLKEFITQFDNAIQEITTMLSKSPLAYWSELKPDDQKNAQKNIDAKNRLTTLSPLISTAKSRGVGADHKDYHNPETIRQRRQTWSLQLEQYAAQKKLGTEDKNNPDSEILERMYRGVSLIKGTLKPASARDISWDESSLTCVIMNDKNTPKDLYIFFNPDSGMWEWKEGTKFFQRVTGGIVGSLPNEVFERKNSPNTPLDTRMGTDPSEWKMRSNPDKNEQGTAFVMQSLARLNTLSKEALLQ